MGKYLTIHSDPNELIRLKKSLQVIKEVLRTYAAGAYSHVGLSCALAISKAEELKIQVSPFCTARKYFVNLVKELHGLYKGKGNLAEAGRQLELIRSYFGLDDHFFVPREQMSCSVRMIQE